MFVDDISIVKVQPAPAIEVVATTASISPPVNDINSALLFDNLTRDIVSTAIWPVSMTTSTTATLTTHLYLHGIGSLMEFPKEQMVASSDSDIGAYIRFYTRTVLRRLLLTRIQRIQCNTTLHEYTYIDTQKRPSYVIACPLFSYVSHFVNSSGS